MMSRVVSPVMECWDDGVSMNRGVEMNDGVDGVTKPKETKKNERLFESMGSQG